MRRKRTPAHWGEIGDTHRAFVERFCSMLPLDGRVLDAVRGRHGVRSPGGLAGVLERFRRALRPGGWL